MNKYELSFFEEHMNSFEKMVFKTIFKHRSIRQDALIKEMESIDHNPPDSIKDLVDKAVIFLADNFFIKIKPAVLTEFQTIIVTFEGFQLAQISV